VLGTTNENRLRKKDNTQAEEKGGKTDSDATESVVKTSPTSSAEEKVQGKKKEGDKEIGEKKQEKGGSMHESKNRTPSSSRILERTDSSLSSPTLPAMLRMTSVECPDSPIPGVEEDEDREDEMEDLPMMLPTMHPQLERQQGFYDRSTSRRPFTGMPNNFHLQGLGQGLGGGNSEEVQIHG